jgi:hypothetical protein
VAIAIKKKSNNLIINYKKKSNNLKSIIKPTPIQTSISLPPLTLIQINVKSSNNQSCEIDEINLQAHNFIFQDYPPHYVY